MKGESREERLGRLGMRSRRRGTREMDLILGAYAQARLSAMSDAELELYDSLLSESDRELYRWVSGQDCPPERFAELIGDIGSRMIGSRSGWPT